MNGRIGLLLGLLALQLLVLGGLSFRNGQDASAAESLLSVTPTTVNRLVIEGREDADDGDDGVLIELALTQTDGQWQVHGYPADAAKIDALTARLADLGNAWPVATTAVARERFEVAEDNFRKRLTVSSADGEAAVLLLGSSPGFKRVHARRGDADAIYSIPLADYDLPTAVDDWLLKGLLATDAAVVRIRRDGAWEAAHAMAEPSTEDVEAAVATRWQVQALGEGAMADASQPADAEAVSRLITRFKGLQVIGVAPDDTLTASDSFTLQTDDGTLLRYTLYEDPEQDRFFVSRDDVPGRFEIAGFLGEQMRLALADLVPAAEEVDRVEAAPAAADLPVAGS